MPHADHPAQALDFLQLDWNATALQAWLPGVCLQIVPTTASTNTDLMARARTPGHLPTVLRVAEQQTAGRGRMGQRRWLSAVGDSLTFSLALELAACDLSGLSLAVGLSLARSLQARLPGAAGGRIGIKWPNDLWLDGARKLAGILIETTSVPGQDARRVVIGIGINLRAPAASSDMRTPPAGLRELDAQLDAPGLLLHLAPALLQDVAAFARTGFAPLVAQFAEFDVLRGRSVWLEDGSSALALGVDASGALRVRNARGAVQSVRSATVGIRAA